MSQGAEFTPTGDARFRKGEHLMLWFQLRTPSRSGSAGKPVQLRVTVVDPQSGHIQADTGLQDAPVPSVAGGKVVNVFGLDGRSAELFRQMVNIAGPRTMVVSLGSP